MTLLAYWPADYAFFIGFMAFLLVACVAARLLWREDRMTDVSERRDP